MIDLMESYGQNRIDSLQKNCKWRNCWGKSNEIVSVPDYSILMPQYSNEMDAIKDFKNGMMGMLAEVYQSCKNFSLSSHNSFPDVAIELLWCTEPVQNQPYQAAIRMFLILRGIGQDEATVASLLDKVANLCTVTLRLQKYTYSDVDVEAFLPLLREVDTSSIIALVKDEKLINLQNMLMPSCLGFDRIPESTAGLSKLVNMPDGLSKCCSIDPAESRRCWLRKHELLWNRTSKCSIRCLME